MTERDKIYYWKCDRPSAFHAIKEKSEVDMESVKQKVDALLTNFFNSNDFELTIGAGQGNHLTFKVRHHQKNYFVRIENGHDGDEYMEIEAEVMKSVQRIGIPTPQIYVVDSSRTSYPFAYQIMEFLEFADLNEIYRKNKLDVLQVMNTLGKYIASWQKLTFEGFGAFNIKSFRENGKLVGHHNKYADYYMLNLEKHLHFLEKYHFIDKEQQKDICDEVQKHERLLDISRGSLVHKDIALWNVMGNSNSILSVIDWDDAISGDPTDDISLMACFHSTDEINAIIEGYQTVNPLPDNFMPRFWLHLLRNMIVKAVIRVGAGYFNRNNDFFLFNLLYSNGIEFHDFTIARLNKALEGLKQCKKTIDL